MSAEMNNTNIAEVPIDSLVLPSGPFVEPQTETDSEITSAASIMERGEHTVAPNGKDAVADVVAPRDNLNLVSDVSTDNFPCGMIVCIGENTNVTAPASESVDQPGTD